MNEKEPKPDIPFSPGDWLNDLNNPAQPGQYGKRHWAGPQVMLQLQYPDGSTRFRLLSCLKVMNNRQRAIDELLQERHFGKVRDLQRLITFEKLKGTLHEVIYSMETARIDFYAYQFKPVLKFITSPTERLIIAMRSAWEKPLSLL